MASVLKTASGYVNYLQWGSEKQRFVPQPIHPLSQLYKATADNYPHLKLQCQSQCEMEDYAVFKTIKKSLKNDFPDHLERVKRAIEEFARIKFAELSPESRNRVDGKIYNLARPITDDAFWGEHHRFDDIPRLLNALLLEEGLRLREMAILKLWHKEELLAEKSQIYDLYRPYLPKGEIGYINGINTTFTEARNDAYFLSDLIHSKPHIRGVYNATHGFKWDLVVSNLMLEKEISPEPILLLLQAWTEFFSRSEPDRRYLQICYSQGALMVETALKFLPPHLQKRIQVIAIAPGAFINIPGVEAIHFIKENDVVPKWAKHHHLIQERHPSIRVVAEDESKSHDLYGRNYVEGIRPIIETYLAS